MSILRYENFLTEKQIFDMINESILVFSPKLINILKKMSRNRIAQELLRLQKTDVEGIAQNYIDITDRENLSFTPDRRVQQLMAGRPIVWRCTQSNKCLTHGSANDAIFGRLEYNKEEPWPGGSGERWSVGVGNVLKLISETTSKKSGKVYCKVEETNADGSDKENPRFAVINKEGIELYTPDLPELWTTARNPLRIGRMARPILMAAGVTFADHELSQFVEQFTATVDFEANALQRFDIVKGEDIWKWYQSNNMEHNGSLGNSCMVSASKNKLSIYTNNDNVNLVILYDDNGELNDGKYTSNRIKGRAILWRNCNINGQVCDFMDRIYTAVASDEELFKQFAEKEGFYYKSYQGYGHQDITNGTNTINRPNIICDLQDGDFSMYPYMDTMYCVDIENNKCSNDDDNLEGRVRFCQHTDGTWEGADEDDAESDDYDDDDW